MPSGTTYNPQNINAFVKTALNFNAQGVSATITAGSTTNIDLVLTDDSMLTGVWLLVDNGSYGDFCNFQIIDTTGAFSGTPGTVLNQFVTNWYTPPTTDVQFDMAYPAKIYATLTLRIIYHSTGTTNPFIAINYKLHKILI
jgi:hypothetical protein